MNVEKVSLVEWEDMPDDIQNLFTEYYYGTDLNDDINGGLKIQRGSYHRYPHLSDFSESVDRSRQRIGRANTLDQWLMDEKIIGENGSFIIIYFDW